MLLVTTKTQALQIFALPATNIPDDPHVQEVFAVPEEVLGLTTIRYNDETVRTALPGASMTIQGTGGSEQVLDVVLVTKGKLWEEYGPVVGFV